tara:strand:- start:1680 stop:1883 length:204 start_codon:yes stop_codon:yes gene_type:complete
MKIPTYKYWKKEIENKKLDPSKMFFTIKRNEKGELTEVYNIYQPDIHSHNDIYNLLEVIDIMEKENV